MGWFAHRKELRLLNWGKPASAVVSSMSNVVSGIPRCRRRTDQGYFVQRITTPEPSPDGTLRSGQTQAVHFLPGGAARHRDPQKILIAETNRDAGYSQRPQSRAGWPGCFIVELVRSVFNRERRPECQNPGIPVSISATPNPPLRIFSRMRKARVTAISSCAAGSPARVAFTTYITMARFSSSCIRTGMAHPAISTRPAASSAAFGDTP